MGQRGLERVRKCLSVLKPVAWVSCQGLADNLFECQRKVGVGDVVCWANRDRALNWRSLSA